MQRTSTDLVEKSKKMTKEIHILKKRLSAARSGGDEDGIKKYQFHLQQAKAAQSKIESLIYQEKSTTPLCLACS